MEYDNNIKIFTAIDIEKYHKGLLTPKERHDLEKAALDDPFLADALEGYSVTGVNADADIAELKKRLSQRTTEAKIIPIGSTKTSSHFPFLRVAVMIVLIAGAGFLVYQLGFNNRSKEIAQSTAKTEELKVADTNRLSAPSSIDSERLITAEGKEQKMIVTNKKNSTSQNFTVQENVGSDLVRKDTLRNELTYSTAQPSAAASEFKKEEVKKSERNDIASGDLYKNNSRQQSKTGNINQSGTIADSDKMKEEVVVNGYGNMNQRQAYQNFNSNVFRGRVMDNNNNPVPFANITNTKDNVGTYSDAKGYFNLTSPDSVLDVQVRSVGFENNNTQLRNSATSNQVVLQNDSKALNEVVISNKKPNAAARSRDANMKLEEPEPADGWDNYDTYLANNLNIPDDLKNIKNKQQGNDVEVSFEVDKNGEPTNIKIEKSLCNKCDEEAIRLIKEGPKWKRKARKGRTTVTISF